MNPFEKLQKSIKDAIAAVNASLASLPPMEQFEANAEMAYYCRRLKEVGAALVAANTGMTQQVVEIQAQLDSAEGAKITAAIEAEKKKLTEGDGALYILKTDHEAAVSGAIAQAVKKKEDDMKAEISASDALSAKREKLVKEKKLPEIAAQKIDAKYLEDAQLDRNVGIVAERLKKLAKLHITPETSAETVGIVASLPLDAAGDADFEARLKTIKGLQDSALAAAGQPRVDNPLAGITAERQETEEEETTEVPVHLF